MIAKAADPRSKLREKEADYKEQLADPYKAAARGYIDEVIRPSETRVKVIRALRMLRNKRGESVLEEARQHYPTGCLNEPRTDGARSYRSGERGLPKRGYWNKVCE